MPPARRIRVVESDLGPSPRPRQHHVSQSIDLVLDCRDRADRVALEPPRVEFPATAFVAEQIEEHRARHAADDRLPQIHAHLARGEPRRVRGRFRQADVAPNASVIHPGLEVLVHDLDGENVRLARLGESGSVDGEQVVPTLRAVHPPTVEPDGGVVGELMSVKPNCAWIFAEREAPAIPADGAFAVALRPPHSRHLDRAPA